MFLEDTLMKKLFLAFVAITIVSSSVQAYSGGNGEPNTPYQIATVADLLYLGSDDPNYDKCFVLTADIDLNPLLPGGQVFTTAVIARIDYPTPAFTGSFDGAGHKIFNLTIDTNGVGNSYLGLFGYIQNDDPCSKLVEIKNLHLENASITGADGSNCLGGLAGWNSSGSICNCSSSGTIAIENSIVPQSRTLGGLVGYNDYGDINNCSSSVYVDGGCNTSGLGGLVGGNYHGNINNCFATGNVSGYATIQGEDCSGLGGLVGGNGDGTINKCYATGNVTGSGNLPNGAAGWDIGGFVGGNNGSSGFINNCYATGTVTSSFWNTGGLVGSNYYSNISYCYSTGAVFCTFDGSYGGLVGFNDYGTVTASFWDINTSGLSISDGGTGQTTAQMKTLSTFTNAGWDFVGETANGTEDIWWILQNITYPKFNWQRMLPPGPGGPGPGHGDGGIYFPDYNFDGVVNFIDFAILANAWMTENPFISLDNDNDVDMYDLKIFCDYWLSYTN